MTRGDPAQSSGAWGGETASLTRTIGIIQARAGSARLPRKVLASVVADRPLLALLAQRVRRAQVAEWWLATTEEAEDDATARLGRELGLRVFRGDTSDVLSRFLAIAEQTGADWLVRVTGDNPFLDAPAIDLLLDARDASEIAKRADGLRAIGGIPADPCDGSRRGAVADAEGRDCANPERHPRLPLGYGAELVRTSALERAAARIPDDQAYHRVHVTSWLSANGLLYEVPTPLDWPDRGDWRWTIDTDEDLAMARRAFALFGAAADEIDYPTMVACLDAHPEIAAMNAHISQKPVEEG